LCTDMHADGFVDIVNIFLVTLSVCLLQKGGEGTKYKMLLSSERFKTSEKRGFSSITAEVSSERSLGKSGINTGSRDKLRLVCVHKYSGSLEHLRQILSLSI